MDILILLLVGLLAGILSGMVGIGGGIIIVPVLVYFLQFSQHKAQGTTLFMFLLPIGILGVMNYYKAGYVDFKTAIIIGSTFVIGSYFGSKWSISLDQKTVKQIFGVIIVLLGLKMIFWK
ncbi:MAG TPA: sulfite exporter TauE/SafE family protein [Bacteroidia bacterium]|nr:sulfite exporter TauE/SafE family protein [Bacteroidia bacterium]HRD38974.1 sulfite exporter TauE/SafE family protein [Bacteroidia bacterium]